MKTCSKCGIKKPVHEFSLGQKRKDGTRPVRSYCRECGRIRNRKWILEHPEKRKEYRDKWTSENRFKAALSWSKNAARSGGYKPCVSQESELEKHFTGKCHSCGVNEESERLCMDHDHETGAFRGWLCRRCNRILGLARDSAEILTRIAQYVLT